MGKLPPLSATVKNPRELIAWLAKSKMDVAHASLSLSGVSNEVSGILSVA